MKSCDGDLGEPSLPPLLLHTNRGCLGLRSCKGPALAGGGSPRKQHKGVLSVLCLPLSLTSSAGLCSESGICTRQDAGSRGSQQRGPRPCEMPGATGHTALTSEMIFNTTLNCAIHFANTAFPHCRAKPFTPEQPRVPYLG